MFQCRTRLCGWCNAQTGEEFQRLYPVSMPHAAIPFRPHHRFAVPLPRSRRGGFSFTVCQLLAPIRGTRAAAKSRRSEKGYAILASPADAGEVASAASRWGRPCRTRLCGWCSRHRRVVTCRARGFNAARGYSFRPHHRFAVPLPRSRRGGLVRLRFLAESRNISFPRRCGGSGEHSEPMGALMPHAALWVVQPSSLAQARKPRLCFNAARGFVGGAASK